MPFGDAPQSARLATAALRVSECLVSLKGPPACVVFGSLASVEAPIVGLVSISTARGVLVTKCDRVEHLWRLLAETPLFTVFLAAVTLDQLEGASWLWQSEAANDAG